MMGKYHIASIVKKELFWWSVFHPSHNGISIMAAEEWSQVDDVIASDTCLQGCGVLCLDREYFHTVSPNDLKEIGLYINML